MTWLRQIIRSELTKGVDRTSDRKHYLYVTSIIRTQYAWHLPTLPFLRTSTAWGITELKGAVHPDMQMLAFLTLRYMWFLTDKLLFVCGKSKEKFSRITFTIKVLHTHYIQSLLDHTKALCKEQTKIKTILHRTSFQHLQHMTNIWHLFALFHSRLQGMHCVVFRVYSFCKHACSCRWAANRFLACCPAWVIASWDCSLCLLVF